MRKKLLLGLIILCIIHGNVCAFSEQLIINNLVFPMGERAFADFASIVEGAIDGDRCDKGGDKGRIENVLGANFDTYIVDHCQSDHEGIIFDVDFMDNYIVNYDGADIAIFELVHLDGFDVAVYDGDLNRFTPYQHVVPIAIEGTLGAVLIDLTHFGFEGEAVVTKLRINTKHIDDGSDQAEIIAIGALHSRPIPGLAVDFTGNGQVGLDDTLRTLEIITGIKKQIQPPNTDYIFRMPVKFENYVEIIGNVKMIGELNLNGNITSSQDICIGKCD